MPHLLCDVELLLRRRLPLLRHPHHVPLSLGQWPRLRLTLTQAAKLMTTSR